MKGELFIITFIKDHLNEISAYSSIIGFIISVFTMGFSIKINHKINHRFKKYNHRKNFNLLKKEWHPKITAYYNLIKTDSLINDPLIADILQVIINFESFTLILNKSDKKKIKELRNLLSNLTPENKIKIYENLSYFLARFSRDEEEELL